MNQSSLDADRGQGEREEMEEGFSIYVFIGFKTNRVQINKVLHETQASYQQK
jgi:hypothetical protein